MGVQMTSRVNIRVSPAEHDAITRRARAAGLSFSEYIRRSALSDSDRPVIRTNAEELRNVYVGLRKAGGLLNQCARELNTRHRPDQLEAELQAAFRAVAQAATDVSEFIADARRSV